MRRFFHSVRVVLTACLLTACAPARTGVIGNTLTTNVKPYISITALPPFSVLAHGTLRPETETDRMGSREMTIFNYAVYADADAHSGPVSRFAYAAITRLEHANIWRFQPPTPSGAALYAGNTSMDGIAFTHQVLRVGDDWGSRIWRENGRETPEYWIAKRWTAFMNDGIMAVMEYREPWPEALTPLSPNLTVISGPAGEALLTFSRRADAVFMVEKKGGTFDKNSPTPPQVLTVPRDPDIAALVGEVVTTGHGQ